METTDNDKQSIKDITEQVEKPNNEIRTDREEQRDEQTEKVSEEKRDEQPIQKSIDVQPSVSPVKNGVREKEIVTPLKNNVVHKEEVEPDDHGSPNDDKENENREPQYMSLEEEQPTDDVGIAQNELIARQKPSTNLEIALSAALQRKQIHVERLTKEILKLKKFIAKRKQTYKRKRKEDGAPTRALSGYNLFIRERFAKLAKENEEALKSEDKDAEMKRVPPASLVAATGNAWKELSVEEKAKYDERAKSDRKRYEDEMAQYQPPDKQANRKRNKTGYNMFFSAHVLRLKQTESGVPSERGSVARLVGTAWKQLSAEDKAYYEREADRHNGMHPVKDGEEEDEEETMKHAHMEYHMHHPEMHMHAGAMPPPPMHDPRHHHAAYYPPHMYGPPPPYAHYDYSQHHQRHQQARAQGYQQGYPPQRHYDG